MINLITNIIAYFLKHANTIAGIIGAVGKLAAGIINIFQPDKDALVDTIDSWTKKIQDGIYKAQSALGKFGQ